MVKDLISVIVASGVLFSGVKEAWACTAFQLTKNGYHVVAQGYDWYAFHGHGGVFVEAAGVQRQGITLKDAPNPATWRSKYGSLVFTQFGKGLPIGGMNEKGLVMMNLQLDPTQYNEASVERPFVNEGQFAQYALDQFASTAELLEKIGTIRVVEAFIGLHYFISDAHGQTAVINFLDGKMNVYSGDTLPVPALTNDPYEYLLEDLRVHGTRNLPESRKTKRTSEARFRTAAHLMERHLDAEDGPLIENAQEIFRAVDINGFASDALFELSQWSILYFPQEKTVAFKTRDFPAWKSFSLPKVLSQIKNMPRVLNMNSGEGGSVDSQFVPYTRAFNDALIEKNWLLLDKNARQQATHLGVTETRCQQLFGE